MDKATARLLLECYRPQDAEDPAFAEALREASADPELAAWFAESRRLDTVLAAKFQEVPVPADVKSHILLGYHAGGSAAAERAPRRWVMPSSIAALLLAGLFSWHFFAQRQNTMSPLALQAIAYTDQMPPLQFVCFNPAAVAGWINKQPGSHQVGLTLPKPPDSLSMAMIGSSVVDWNGQPVVMICLQDGKRMAMLYVMKAGGSEEPPEGGDRDGAAGRLGGPHHQDGRPDAGAGGQGEAGGPGFPDAFLRPGLRPVDGQGANPAFREV